MFAIVFLEGRLIIRPTLQTKGLTVCSRHETLQDALEELSRRNRHAHKPSLRDLPRLTARRGSAVATRMLARWQQRSQSLLGLTDAANHRPGRKSIKLTPAERLLGV